MIKAIISGITMLIIDGYMASLYSKRKNMTPQNQNSTQYAIQIPKEATKVFLVMMYFGVFLFVFWSIFLFMGNETVSGGHLIFASIISIIGAGIALWSKSWIIVVNGNQLEYQSILHKKEVFTFEQIEKVETDSKGAVGMYINGRRVIVSILCENQDYLIQSLKEHGKWIENNELTK